MTELKKVLNYKGFCEKFEELKKVDLPQLPEEVNEFVDQAQFYEGANEDIIKEPLNRYHLYAEAFDELRIDAAVKYFQAEVPDLNLDEERIATVYIRLYEEWVGNYETAIDEVRDFIRFTKLLKLK